MVLNTLGRLYVKVQDRYYEIDFRNQTNGSDSTSDVIAISSDTDVNNLNYPGDDKLIISEDGRIWITKNGEFKSIELKINQDELVVNNITVNSQLTLNSADIENPPIVINSPILIKNLNAEFLNDRKGDEYGVKAKSEIITGTWQFKNMFVTNNIYSKTGSMNLDFNNNSIQVSELTVTDKVTLPPGVIPDFDKNENANYSGLKPTTIWGREITYDSFDSTEEPYNPLMDFLEYAYDLNYLDNSVNEVEITVDQWTDVFFNMDPETEEYIPIDVETNLEQIQQKIIDLGITDKTIDDYNIFLSNFKTADITGFNGEYIQLEKSDLNILPFGTILLNDLITFNVTGNIGKIVDITTTTITVKLQNESDFVEDDNSIILNPKFGKAYIQVSGDNTPYMNISDTKTKVQIGNLSNISDSYKDKIGLYADEPYLKNVNIDFGNIKSTEITSGIISDSNLSAATITGSVINNNTLNDNTINKGTINNAVINNPNITNGTTNNNIINNSTIDGSTITNSTIDDSTINNPTINSGTINTATINNSTIDGSTLTSGTISETTLSDSDITDVIINNTNFKYNADHSGQIGDRIHWDANGIVNLTVDRQEKIVRFAELQNEVVDLSDADVVYAKISGYQDIENGIKMKLHSVLVVQSAINNNNLHIIVEEKDYNMSFEQRMVTYVYYTTRAGLIKLSLTATSGDYPWQ